jgi:outer membrane protein OmpA-like peptidoglycan-associated protein
MSFPLATLLLLSSQEPAAGPAAQEVRWVGCGGLESPQGRVIVDRLAYVFFDPGSSAITPAAAAVLDNYVAGYDQPVPSPRCLVTIGGNADRAGAAEYNLLLSRRRAEAVATYLRNRGLTAPLLVEGYGETRPLVDTDDGLREPQNRYVVVVVGDQSQLPPSP